MIINTPKEVNTIIQKLNNSGFEAFIVGGCVRDCIMGNAPHDWDICTSAKPDQTQACFCDYKTIDVGKKHGTIGVVMHGGIYEITTYRVDGEYEDNRHPQSVEFTSNINDDLSRRDFTVNAMAYNEKDGFVDSFGGREDIANKLIKCVGNPTDRFNEDSLRILRGLRFASRFDFEIEANTAKAIHDCKSLLHNVANERIREELIGILCGKSAEKILNDYRDVILPDAAIVYADPPYNNTTAYFSNEKFNTSEFWQYARDISERGHLIFISELHAPEDFVCVWQKQIKRQLDCNKNNLFTSTEKLFVHRSFADELQRHQKN